MSREITRDVEKTPADSNAAADLSHSIWQGSNMLLDRSVGHSTARTNHKDSTLAPFTITDNSAKAAALGSDSKSNPLAGKHPEANSLLIKAAEETVNQSIYKLPSWSRLTKPDPDIGCVSSFSSRYREALHLAGRIDSNDDKAYRDLYQVNLDQFNKVMSKSNLLSKISSKDIKEGDVIEGVTPDTSKRHIGIVGGIENGQRMVYDNVQGTWTKEPLDSRFGQYKQENFYRAYLPPTK